MASTIAANAIEPTTSSSLNTEIVYAENTEWAISGATGTINPASTSSPISGTVSMLHTNPEHQKSIYFSTPTAKFTSSDAVLQLDIKLKKSPKFKSLIKSTVLKSGAGEVDIPLNLSIVTLRTFPNKGLLTCIITILFEGNITKL